MTWPIPPHVFNLTTLEELIIIGATGKSYIPENIGKLTLLSVLDLYNSNIHGDFPIEISRLKLLNRLEIGENPYLNQPNLKALLSSLNNLVYLNIAGNNEFIKTDRLTAMNASLKSLVIGGGRKEYANRIDNLSLKIFNSFKYFKNE